MSHHEAFGFHHLFPEIKFNENNKTTCCREPAVEFLSCVSKRMSGLIRKEDLVCVWGGGGGPVCVYAHVRECACACMRVCACA